MRTLIALAFTAFIMLGCMWIHQYTHNRSKLCSEPTIQSKIGKYLYCYPGIYVPKGTLLDGVSPLEGGFDNFISDKSEK